MTSILEISDYSLDYVTKTGPRRALDSVSLSIAKGEVLGLVGESGSGKTSIAWAIMRYLPRNARELGGSIKLAGQELRGADDKSIEQIRGDRIGMVFQDPSTSLNPTLTLGLQVSEVLMRHRGMSLREARAETVELLRHLDLRHPEAMLDRYPHEVSGGEKQRVVIATALACRPDLIIFDEPTSALDVINGGRLLELFERLRKETGVAALYISHDLKLVSRVADRVTVIKRGTIVETGPTQSVYETPKAEYTRDLLDAIPQADKRLTQDDVGENDLLAARDITVRYGRTRLFGSTPQFIGAKDVSLSVRRGEILGVVGESGSGKSTFARAITGLTRFSGEIDFAGRRIVSPGEMDIDYRKAIQLIFQNPDSSLNPRHRIRDILARPLHLYGGDPSSIPAILEQVQLPASYANRFPHELSGGEKQRVAIARAFAAKPALIICDEVTSALDVSVQKLIIDLLLKLRAMHGTAYVFITHDIALVQQIAHRIAVMLRGELVDLRPASEITRGQIHPYTRALLDASSGVASDQGSWNLADAAAAQT